MKWALALFLLLAAFLAGAYGALPWILQQVIIAQAADRDVVVRELSIRRPGWDRVLIDRVAISVAGNDVEAEGIAVGYTWNSLSAGRATEIEIVKLAAVVASGAADDRAPQAPPLEVGELIAAAPGVVAAAWEIVPADSIIVAEVRIENGAAGFVGAIDVSRSAASIEGRLDGPLPMPSLQLAARLEPATRLLQLDASEVDAPGQVVELRANLETATGTLGGNWAVQVEADAGLIDVRVNGSAAFALHESDWVLESGFLVKAATDDWRAAFDLAEARGAWSIDTDNPVRVNGEWQGAFEADAFEVAGRGKASAELDLRGARVELEPGTVAELGGFGGDGWSIDDVDVGLVDAAGVQLGWESLDYRLDAPVQVKVGLKQAVWSEYRFDETVDVTLRALTGDPGSLESSFDFGLPLLQLSGSARAVGNLPDGPFNLKLDTEQSIDRPFLAGLFPGAPPAYDLDAGNIRTTGTLQLDPARGELSGAVSVTLADLDAHFEEIEVAGFGGELQVVVEPDVWRIGPDRVAVAALDVGFPIADLGAEITVTAELLAISDVHARTLGGNVGIESMDYSIASGSSEFVVTVTGIRLAEVLALEGDTITGEGILDGQLPVQINDNLVRVSEGNFSARAPGGVVSYGGAEEAAASLDQPGVGFAIAALGDFRYGVLDVGVTYEPSGDLLLGIHLEGRNPRFEEGRPIHYNLNISENIPVLLQSLQLSDEVGRQLEKRIVQDGLLQ